MTLARRDASVLARVGVVVVHFHREQATAALVRQLVEAGVPENHVMIADNGSTPVTLETALADRGVAPEVRAFDNVGYAAAVNAVVTELPPEVDTVCLLTHEVELVGDCLRVLCETLWREPEVGLVGPLLLEHAAGHNDAVWSAGGVYRRGWHVPDHRLHGADPDDVPAGLSPRCRWLDGAVLVLRRHTWLRIGGLDERYFLYHEDVDLAWRIERLGLQVWMVPEARARQTSGNHLNAWLSTRNMTLLLRTQRRPVALSLWVAQAAARAFLGRIPRGGAGRLAEARGRWAGLRAGLQGQIGRPPDRHWP